MVSSALGGSFSFLPLFLDQGGPGSDGWVLGGGNCCMNLTQIALACMSIVAQREGCAVSVRSL